MPSPKRGEVWLVDLGFAAKIRPCLVLSVRAADSDRALIALVPHTTSIRHTQFEAVVAKPFMKAGVFDPQGLVTVSPPRMIRKLGELTMAELTVVETAVRKWLGL